MKIKDFFLGDGCDLNFELINSLDEIKALKTAEQNPRWHAEGNAYDHTMKCLDHVQYAVKSYTSISRKRRVIVAVLLHDIGKPNTTQFIKDSWHSYGHEFAGEHIARKLLWDEHFEERERVCCLIRNHMSVLHAFNTDISVMLRNMSKFMPDPFFNWEDELNLKTCDILGSIQEDKSNSEKDIAKICTLIMASSFFKDTRFGALSFNNLIFKEYEKFDKKLTVTFLIGLPGAGKDTYAKTIEGTILCRDDIREELGYCKKGEKIVGNNEEENNVSKIFHERLIEALKNGHNVVINNINLKKKYRDEIKTLILDSGIRVKYNYVYIETKLENNLKRRPTIGKEIFYKMIMTFDWPNYKEYDNLQIITNRYGTH